MLTLFVLGFGYSLIRLTKTKISSCLRDCLDLDQELNFLRIRLSVSGVIPSIEAM